MTDATEKLIRELSLILDKHKYLMLSGGMAVGKTYLAGVIAERLALPEYDAQGRLPEDRERYDVITEIVPIHPSFSYEDFVTGISVDTVDGRAVFCHEDKIFLSMLKQARESWSRNEAGKYVIILDDIGRGFISGILGDMLPLMEPHGNGAYRILRQGMPDLWITPNVYIIATRSTAVDPVEPYHYSFFRHFYDYMLENDYRYMSDEASETYSEYEVSSNAMYHRCRRIVRENLRHRYQMCAGERDRYVPGHGIYQEKGVSMLMRYQILPLLKQYRKDGILDRTAGTGIDALQKLVDGAYSKDPAQADTERIRLCKKGITAELFENEGMTHRPLVNLVSRIKEQGLLDDSDIAEGILFNPQVLIRKKAKLDGVERTFHPPGYLCVERSTRDIYTYGTTLDGRGRDKRPRFFYSGNKNDVILVDGLAYAFASEMQPGEYTRWYEEQDSGTEENERYSSSPNSVMFRILRSYYRTLDHHFAGYLAEHPGDENIIRLRAYAGQEYRLFISETRKLHPEISDEKDVNAKANNDFRKVIQKLTLLWKNRGEIINAGGQAIVVEGVYRVISDRKYEEYSRAMETLGIHQMIMQGPPGTSKTHTTREYLKFAGKGPAARDPLTDEELDALQIRDYPADGPMCGWEEEHTGETPVIAWDIVQFHPSYGYEDFVRGIEVSTVRPEGGGSSSVSYDTVNKILGKMAELAARPRYRNTRFYLVIDEINRANLATVFGELIYGLEYRGRSVATPYTVADSNKVMLPDRLYILGTMNTADKSVGGIDYAIRRRFLFFSLLPDRKVILEFRRGMCDSEAEETGQIEVNEKAAALFDRIAELFCTDTLNAEYYRDDVQIGHTYFLVTSEEQLYLRFRYQILPILREYYKDGMFRFDRPETDDDGRYGLTGCITGDIDINNEEDRVKDIFGRLTGTV